MNKFELYALGHYLTDWPEELSFKQIMNELKSGDDGMVLDIHYHYEEISPEQLAIAIEDMTESLQGVFK